MPGDQNRGMLERDAQQRAVLGRLRDACGRPLTFAELRDGGVWYPASTVSELVLAGYAIERVHDEVGRLMGVRLRDTRSHPVIAAAPARGRPWRLRRPLPDTD
jgi:hypothetical protein